MADSEPPPITIFGKELHDSHLTEIGRVTTTWALFESKVDTMIWDLAGVDSRLGACMTTQIGSIHGRFRALLSLLHEAQVPELLIKTANKLSQDADSQITSRNKYAHSPVEMGFESVGDWQDGHFRLAMYLSRVTGQKKLTFELQLLSLDDLLRSTGGIKDLIARLQSLREEVFAFLKTQPGGRV